MKKIKIEHVLKIVNENLFSDDLEIEDNEKKKEKYIVTKDRKDVNLEDYGIDSISFIRIIVALEEFYECEIPEDKLLLSEMGTVQKIMDVLDKLLATENCI